MNALVRRSPALAALVVAAGTGGFSLPAAAAQQAPDVQKTFASPDDAVAALRAAAEIRDQAALRDIFGPQVRELLTGDAKQDAANSRGFARALAEGAKAVPENDGTIILEIGKNGYPFPIPLVKENSAWRFDTAAGKEEIINRHIGKDELHVIGFCRAYVQQRGPGGGAPLPKRFHGYFFRSLTRGGGGPADADEFVLAAYPEHWGRSGVMTFIIDRSGKIYRSDLGAEGSRLAAAMTGRKPDGDWTEERDLGVTEK